MACIISKQNGRIAPPVTDMRLLCGCKPNTTVRCGSRCAHGLWAYPFVASLSSLTASVKSAGRPHFTVTGSFVDGCTNVSSPA